MIRLTRLNHVPLVLNSDLIEHIEVTPDTVISLTTGQKIVVLESADEVIGRVREFRHDILKGTCPLAGGGSQVPARFLMTAREGEISAGGGYEGVGLEAVRRREEERPDAG